MNNHSSLRPSRRAWVASLAAAVASTRTPATASPWQPRLSTSTVHYPRLPVVEACERIAKLGYEAVDIWSSFQGCTHLEEAKEALGADGLRQILNRLNLKLAAVSVYRAGYEPFAGLLGELEGGIAVRGSTADTDGPLTPKMRAFLDSLKPLADLAARHNTRIAIENHSGKPLLNRLESLKAFADLNQSPQLGIALAPYHIQKNGESVEKAIEICGRQLLFFYAWQWGEGLAQLPGHGPTDFTPWLDALARAGYDGPVNIFMHGDIAPDLLSAALAKSRRYILERRGQP